VSGAGLPGGTGVDRRVSLDAARQSQEQGQGLSVPPGWLPTLSRRAGARRGPRRGYPIPSGAALGNTGGGSDGEHFASERERFNRHCRVGVQRRCRRCYGRPVHRVCAERREPRQAGSTVTHGPAFGDTSTRSTRRCSGAPSLRHHAWPERRFGRAAVCAYAEPRTSLGCQSPQSCPRARRRAGGGSWPSSPATGNLRNSLTLKPGWTIAISPCTPGNVTGQLTARGGLPGRRSLSKTIGDGCHRCRRRQSRDGERGASGVHEGRPKGPRQRSGCGWGCAVTI
jgi:hypothetical protein